MDSWELDFYFLQVRHVVKEALEAKELPDMRSILFVIGIQELGFVQKEFSKEEKQDLMHVAVCSLLEEDGYYDFEGKDDDGWPHWKVGIPFKTQGVKEQELILKEKIINYFQEYIEKKSQLN